jgi:plasmid stabilization system protein ParE
VKIRYLPRAVGDLAEIGEFIAERNPAAARAVEGKIRETVSEHPEIGRALDQRPGVRVMPVVRYPYLIFYESVGAELLILHVRHGARAPLDPEEL